jgi:[ribosomal protein S18]-alanine N-acetyltransferase
MMRSIKDSDFIIRDYREDDFNGIARLWELTGISSPERGDTHRIVGNTIRLGGKLLVMEEKVTGKISGTSWMTFDGRRILLHHFAILPEFQGNGLSKTLLNESLRFVKDKGYQVKLEVHSSNKKAINIYKKSGFTHLDGYDVYIIRDIEKL